MSAEKRSPWSNLKKRDVPRWFALVCIVIMGSAGYAIGLWDGMHL